MTPTFREYTQKDKLTLLTLVNELEEYVKSIDPLHRLRNSPGYSKLALKELLDNVKKYNGKIWLAQVDDTVVGYIAGVIWKQSAKNKLEIGPHTLGEILDLYVREPFRGQGLGKQMLSMMETYFKNQGCDSMWILVFSPNEKAHKLYTKLGFQDRETGLLKQL